MDATLEQSLASKDSAGIDKEHQVQIEMLEAFCNLVHKNESQVKIQEVLDQLTSYSEVHFMSEQLLMRMYAFPDYDDHVTDHEAMIEYLKEIKQRFTSGQNDSALESANEMKRFLLNHIGNRDQAFSNYLTTMKPG